MRSFLLDYWTNVTTTVMRLFDKFAGASDLRARLARGGFWLVAGSAGSQGLRLLRNMILARLLVPEIFGQMAIINAVNALFESFTQIGLREAVVQSPQGHQREYLNGVFFVSAIRGFILYAVAFILVPLVAAYYDKPDMVTMMRVAFLNIFFAGLVSPRAYASLKSMDFKKYMFVFNGGSSIGIIAAIIVGFFMQNVWVLIIGLVLESFSFFIISYILCPFFPSRSVDRESLNHLLTFSRNIFGLPILVFIFSNLDVFVLGKMIDDANLGKYSMALGLSQIPFILYGAVLNPLLLPAFSSLQSDSSKLGAAIIKSARYINLAFLPLVTGLFLFSDIILRLCYGVDYVVVSGVFKILCLSLVMKVIGTVLVNALFSVGKPQHTREASIIRVVVMAVLIVPLVMKMGMLGAALSSFIASTAWLFLIVYRVRRTIGLNTMSFLRSLDLGMAASCVIGMAYIVTYMIRIYM
jgi:lipopolysaccharide exporter